MPYAPTFPVECSDSGKLQEHVITPLNRFPSCFRARAQVVDQVLCPRAQGVRPWRKAKAAKAKAKVKAKAKAGRGQWMLMRTGGATANGLLVVAFTDKIQNDGYPCGH